MKYYYHVSYSVYEEGRLYKDGTFGLMHHNNCITTTIKTIIKRGLPPEKKALEIIITKSELISEEEAKRRFGINILDVRFRRRLVK